MKEKENNWMSKMFGNWRWWVTLPIIGVVAILEGPAKRLEKWRDRR